MSRYSAGPKVTRRALASLLAGLMCLVLVTACGSESKQAQESSNQTTTENAIAQDGQSVQQESPAQPTTYEPVEINLLAAGDILQHQQVWESGMFEDGSFDYNHFFSHIDIELANKDIKIVNQETPIGGDELGFTSFPTFNGPQAVGDAEAAAGFNVILKASNHSMDAGYEGLKNELAFWSGHPEVTVIGAHNPDDPATSVDDVYVFEKGGLKVALLNYTFDLNGYEDPENAISMLEDGHVRATMARANELADIIVVLPHWGEEYQLEPVESQYEWANLFVELGADVIIGGHPHVIEPVEQLVAADGHTVPCFWSVGNFISTSPDNESLVGGLAEVTLKRDEQGNCSVTNVTFVPVVTHLGAGADMTTYPLYEWSDELAESNVRGLGGAYEPENTSCTLGWVDEFCAGVLGRGFNAETGIFVLES